MFERVDGYYPSVNGGVFWSYEGEVDKRGEPFGVGTKTYYSGATEFGTWL